MALDLTTSPNPYALRTGHNGTGSDHPLGVFLTGTEAAATIPTAKTDPVIGLTRQIMKAGYDGPIAVGGRELCLAGSGGVTAGQRIMPEANTGKGVAFSAASGANATVCGIAVTSADADAYFLIELAGPGSMMQGA